MGLFKSRQEKLDNRAHAACGASNLAKLEKALDDGANVDFTRNGISLLFHAAWHRFPAGVELLLNRNADIATKKNDGHTPLMEAANDGSFEIARMLVEKGADVNAARADGWTALHFAANNGKGDIVRLLLANNVDVTKTDNRMNTAADNADAKHPRLADLIRGKKREEPEMGNNAPQWRLTAPDEVSLVASKPAIGYRLTEIFNFTDGLYTRISRNLETNAESQSVRFFDEFNNRAAIEAARAALLSLGGKAPDDATKPALKPREFGA